MDIIKKSENYINILEAKNHFDDTIESLNILSKAVKAYYDALIECEFTSEHAIYLVSEFQNKLFTQQK